MRYGDTIVRHSCVLSCVCFSLCSNLQLFSLPGVQCERPHLGQVDSKAPEGRGTCDFKHLHHQSKDDTHHIMHLIFIFTTSRHQVYEHDMKLCSKESHI